ncbi:MAG TPA: 4Fe-4S binding protein [Candidatus Pelethocola excrementipullorum]|nr:4Fe-4S binding protein [Candidatus Pelethocola excrementipullorum]
MKVKKIAFVKCGGEFEKREHKSANCAYGCMACSACISDCKFDAIDYVNGVAVVDEEKCKGCGKCAKVCPQGIIEMIPAIGQYYKVRCSSKAKGKAVTSACDAGCIGCKKCTKDCPADAVKVEDNLAYITYDDCLNCGVCKDVCPRGCIVG